MADDKTALAQHEITFHTLHALVQAAPLGIALLDREFRYVLINDTLARLNGHAVAAHSGRSVKDIIPAQWSILHPIYAEVLRSEKPVIGVEMERTTPRGEVRDWLTSYYPVRGEAGDVTGIGVIATDVTDRKRAERELMSVSEYQRAILAALPDVIFELGADSRHISFHAPETSSLLVAPEHFLGKTVREVLPPNVADVYENAIARTLGTSQMQMFEYDLEFPGDTTRAFDARMVKKTDDRVIVVVRDITERRRLEEQYRHAQKMEAVGRLAGGIAHDFNNLLTVINGCTAMVLEDTTDAESKELLNEVSRAGQRAAGLTRQLLTFSRQQVVDPRVVDLNDVVVETERMLRRLIGEDVQLETRLAPDLRLVRIDRGQLEQVLANLIVNARDAMPNGGGRIVIMTENVPVAAGYAVDGTEMRAGTYAMLTVRDTGLGIDDATRARMFEPFFTTKAAGIGTGLGLAVVFGVVKESGGYIRVHTERGKGTACELFFPALDDGAVAYSSPPSTTGDMPGGRETILLVEDDPAVRTLVVRILQSCGYTVLTAADGREALTLSKSHVGGVDMLISDVVIPHFSGRELAEEVQRLRPGIHVLFISGYTDDEVLRRGVLGAHMAFLQKPFTAQALAQRVREELDVS